MKVRLLEDDTVGMADELRARAGFNQSLDDWRRLLALEPDGCFAAEYDGCIVGTVTTTCYGRQLAWIGMMLVDPSVRGRGVGRRLLETALTYLEERNIERVGLDATPAGRRIYGKFGFVDHGMTITRWEGRARIADVCERPTLVDAAALEQMDRQAFGAGRGRMLRALVSQAPGGFAVERSEEMTGYALIRPGAERWHIGPIAARGRRPAEEVLASALAWTGGEPVEIDVPDMHRRIVQGRGLAPVRSFTRMFLGGRSPATDASRCFAIAAPELG